MSDSHSLANDHNLVASDNDNTLVLWTGESVFCQSCSHHVQDHYTRLVAGNKLFTYCNATVIGGQKDYCRCTGFSPFTPYVKKDLKKN